MDNETWKLIGGNGVYKLDFQKPNNYQTLTYQTVP